MGELVALANRLGAPVFSEPVHTHGRLAFPADHPLYAQTIGLWAPDIAGRLAEFDVLLVAGMDLLREYVYHGPTPAIPPHLRLIHLDENAYQIGKNYPVEVGLLGAVKVGLAELDSLLAGQMSADQRDAAAARGEQRAERHRRIESALRERIAGERAARPMTSGVLMESLSRILPANVAVVEEAVTTTGTLFERLGALRNTDGYFGHRGWALGWGLGVSLGVKLAWPERPVLALIGEGAALYGIQALWSAARHKLNVTFVICNNAQYQILKAGSATSLGLPAARSGKFVGMDLDGLPIDMVALARSLGVASERVSEPDELAQKVSQSLHAADGPRLFDVPIERTLRGPG